MSEQKALTVVTSEQLQLVKSVVFPDSTDAELKLFLYECARRGVHPLDRKIFPIKRNDSESGTKKLTFQCSIDYFRSAGLESGEYDGQDEPEFGPVSDQGFPEWATVKIYRKGISRPFVGVARWKEYYPGEKMGFMWRKMPHGQLAKCFSPDTEVLTDKGFQPFPEVTGRILEVTEEGLFPTNDKPFFQIYAGDMITCNNDMLNFMVTPNHDMITTLGKVEAGAMMATAKYSTKSPWLIPMKITGSREEWSPCERQLSDDDLRLIGYILADGSSNGYRNFQVAVSKKYKRDELDKLNPKTTRVVHSKGAIAKSAIRKIRTNFDKILYVFEAKRVDYLIDSDKNICESILLKLTMRQAKSLLDAWQLFDGYTNKKTGVRRIYTSRPDHVKAIEVLAVMAGYSISTPKKRFSDISKKVNYSLTISNCAHQRASLAMTGGPGLRRVPNVTTEVWCVNVPSHVIIVRRNGFSFVCGNCAEALAFRKAFPQALGGMHTDDEMLQADAHQAGHAVTSLKESVKEAGSPSPAPQTESRSVKDMLKSELAAREPNETARAELLKTLSIFGRKGSEKWITSVDAASDKWCEKVLENLRKLPPINQQQAPAGVVKGPDGCTLDPSTCAHSKWVSDAPVVCGSTGKDCPFTVPTE